MIMKRAFNLLFFVLLAIAAQGQAKYVFYFIGDGMGLNHVNGTEMYLAALQDGRIHSNTTTQKPKPNNPGVKHMGTVGEVKDDMIKSEN